MAAQVHGVPEATRLLNQLEAAYRASWPGHAEASDLLETVTKELETWHVESASAAVSVGRSAIAAAKRTGDDANRLGEAMMRDSIAAKHSAYTASRRTGVPYVDPVGPDPTPTRETTPIFDANPTSTVR
jgi:hypothetical protein